MVEDRHRFIGIDVGGTKILGVVVDPASGEIQARHKAPTPRSEPDELPAAIAAVVGKLADETGSPVGIGVGVPGLVDHQGVLHYGPNVPGVMKLDIAGVLRTEFGIPVVAENDASCAALAEHRLGAARGTMHAVVVTQGTGIGGGLIVGGRLLRGSNGFAGEPGHMMVDRSGPLCACGRHGCWEAVSSGTGLANLARQIVSEGGGARIVELAGGEPGHIRGEHVSAAMAEGDTDAATVLDRFAGWVAEGIASLVTLLDPDVVVLGGGLTVINQHFIADVRERVMPKVMGGAHRPAVPIVPARLGAEAGAIGAAVNARDLLMGVG
jgi:glucokinase